MKFLSSVKIYAPSRGSGVVLIDQSDRTIGEDPSGICDEFNGHYGIHRLYTEDQHQNTMDFRFSVSSKCNIFRTKLDVHQPLIVFWAAP